MKKKKISPDTMAEVVEAIDYFRKALQAVPNANALIEACLSVEEKFCVNRLCILSGVTTLKEEQKL